MDKYGTHFICPHNYIYNTLSIDITIVKTHFDETTLIIR